MLPRLAKVLFNLVHFLPMLIDIKERDAPDTDLQKAFNVGAAEFTDELLVKWFKADVNRVQDCFIGLTLLDLFIDPLLDENPFEGPEMQFVLKLGFFELELALECLDQLRRVFAKHFGDSHLNRAVVLDDNDTT